MTELRHADAALQLCIGDALSGKSTTTRRHLKLNDGNIMPCIGFGCYQSADPYASVTRALQSGYSYVDTARVYKNETHVGQAVRDAINAGGIDRESLFITTKVNARSHNSKETPKAVRQSLSRLGMGYVDLYLLHDAISGRQRRREAWQALVEARNRGLIRSIGVSNWSARHFEELLGDEGSIRPAVNQVELHPWCQQKSIVEYCQTHGIILQAYCPIVRGERLADPVVADIAAKAKKTTAQILLRWSLQKGYCPVVKSDTPARIEENIDIFDFELSIPDMELLDSLDLGSAGACSWNPVDCA